MWYYNLCAMTYIICCNYADVAELADAPDLGSGVTDVGVQVPSSAPTKMTCRQAGLFCCVKLMGLEP